MCARLFRKLFEEGKTYADTNYGESKCYPNYLNIYNTFKDQEADELKYTHKILVAFRELYTTINEKNKQKKLKLFTDENKFTKTGIQGANEYRSMTHTQVIDELLKRIRMRANQMIEKGAVSEVKKYLKLKILGSGEIKKNIEISAHFASKQALAKIEKAGGKISIIKK